MRLRIVPGPAAGQRATWRADVPVLRGWWKTDWVDLLICAVTTGAVVFGGVLVGVAVGVGLSLVKVLYKFSHLVVHVRREGHRTVLVLQGAATFLRLPRLAEAI